MCFYVDRKRRCQPNVNEAYSIIPDDVNESALSALTISISGGWSRMPGVDAHRPGKSNSASPAIQASFIHKLISE